MRSGMDYLSPLVENDLQCFADGCVLDIAELRADSVHSLHGQCSHLIQ